MMIKKLIIVLAAGMVILTGCQQTGGQEAVYPSEPQVITFADSMVEQETRKILNKPAGAITEAEVLTITQFGRRERDGVTEYFEGEITTLSDLKWFKNLKRLYLPSCDVQSLEGIEELTALEVLDVRNNKIESIEPVKNLKNLVELDCADNPVGDYSVLSGLTKLEWLSIGGNMSWTADLSMIKNLKELKTLSAPYCGISDLSPLKNLDKLEYLKLGKNDIDNIEVLAGMQRLNYLDIEDNQISDISVLYALPNLQTVDLDKNPIPDGELKKFYEPRESDYVTVTFQEKIREDMPLFRFDLAAHYNREKNAYALDSITVTDLSDEKILQVTSIPELTHFGETAIVSEETMGFNLEDMNFDGYQDVRLYDTMSGNYLFEWIYLIWNPQKQQFERDERLNEIPSATFDQENKVIYGMTRGSASSHTYFTYQYEGQEILLMERVSEDYDYLTRNEIEQLKEVLPSLPETAVQILHIVREKRNMSTNEMETVENTISTVIEGTEHEYSPDSPVDRKIREIEGLD